MQEQSRQLTRWIPVLGCVGWLTVACSSEPGDALIQMLPADHQIEAWVKMDPPVLAKTDGQLYNQIDGAAPKYIDQGWQASIYASYVQGGQSIQVAIHDMGNADNAQAIFNRYLPVSRVAIAGLDSAVVDTGLLTAYSGTAFVDRYYIEVSIDDRSDAALASVKEFVLAIGDHG
jgi:hypothetical protein